MRHQIDPEDLKPCRHMQTWVSAWLDGKLTGLAGWYTKTHVAGCPQCQASLPFLRGLRERLSTLAEQSPAVSDAPACQLPPAKWDTVETAWEQTDSD